MPQTTTSVALFDCPHCIDEFRFDYHKIAKLTCGWRVRVRCPGCGNIVQVVMLAYTLIHGCDPNKYQAGEIVEILPPDPTFQMIGGCRLTLSEERFSKRRQDGEVRCAKPAALSASELVCDFLFGAYSGRHRRSLAALLLTFSLTARPVRALSDIGVLFCKG